MNQTVAADKQKNVHNKIFQGMKNVSASVNTNICS